MRDYIKTVTMTNAAESFDFALPQEKFETWLDAVFKIRNTWMREKNNAYWLMNKETREPITTHPNPDPEMVEYIGAIMYHCDGAHWYEVYDINENGEYLMWDTLTKATETHEKDQLAQVSDLACYSQNNAVPFIPYSRRPLY